jgi:hypothetical protein
MLTLVVILPKAAKASIDTCRCRWRYRQQMFVDNVKNPLSYVYTKTKIVLSLQVLKMQTIFFCSSSFQALNYFSQIVNEPSSTHTILSK